MIRTLTSLFVHIFLLPSSIIVPIANANTSAEFKQTQDEVTNKNINTKFAIKNYSSSTTPVKDDRIGQLWVDNRLRIPQKRCTVNHLNNNMWITARHCVITDNNETFSGYIKRSDGQSAKVKSVHTKSPRDDIALVEVFSGIKAGNFTLPDKSLSVSNTANLVGYGGSHDYPSVARVRVVKNHSDLQIGGVNYSNIIETSATTDSWSCNGDSGGAIYSAGTIYAVHTAGGSNPACKGRKGGKMWHTDLYSYRFWINSIIESQ